MSVLSTILPGVIEGALRGALTDSRGAVNPTQVARDAAKRIASDPVMVNELNAEAPIQSRVVVGSTIGLVGMMIVSGAHLIEMVQSGTVDISIAAAEVAAMWGAGYALYGRLSNGLRPLFS